MNTIGLLPFWILCAPLAIALIDWARTPKVRRQRA